jgi:hypothetical protein
MVLMLYLWAKSVRKIRAVAISHLHPDHIYGLFAILRNFPVEEVWLVQLTIEDKRYEELAEVIAENDIKERVLYSGDKITIGPYIEVFCLHPPNSMEINSCLPHPASVDWKPLLPIFIKLALMAQLPFLRIEKNITLQPGWNTKQHCLCSDGFELKGRV